MTPVKQIEPLNACNLYSEVLIVTCDATHHLV